MALVPWRPHEDWWDPFTDLERIQKEMNALFNTSRMRGSEHDSGLLDRVWSPAVDIFDSKDNLMVKADIPGLSKDDIDVSVQGDMLIIKGEKKKEHEVKEKDYVRTERFYGSFHRAIRLPSEIQADKVDATYKNGVLELILPKSEKSKPKQIKLDIK
jgi:HSP20 family protein